MISRLEALHHIGTVPALGETETAPLHACVGRVLATSVLARHTHPPDNMSAMDGYAVRIADATAGAKLHVIGEAAAGHPFAGQVRADTCVRVFTGSVIPDGADHVVIQEDVTRTGDAIEINQAQSGPRHIRAAGIDFNAGDVILNAGTCVSPRHLSICAAANHAELTVIRRPRVALLANGDELRPPGSTLGPGQIIASNEYTLTALIEAWGGDVVNLGIAPDDPIDIKARIKRAQDADLFVPVGGASVGDHDHMKAAFADLGFQTVFSRIAVRPGKPTWMSKSDAQWVLGLPGNPASALVCAHLFLRPLLLQMLGRSAQATTIQAKLDAPMDANGSRESFSRGIVSFGDAGERIVSLAGNQDSSLLSPFVTANVLVHRPIDSPAREAGETVNCVLLD